MSRRAEAVVWVGTVTLGVAAGLAIAGPPLLGDTTETLADADAVVIVPTDSTSTTASTSTTTTVATSTSTSTSTTLAPVPAARPTNEVTVVVVNGTSVPGAAARLTDRLAADGHPTLTPTSVTAFAASEVWFADGFGTEAAAIAERLGVFPENVMLVPPEPGFDIGDADVVVVIGPDLAE